MVCDAEPVPDQLLRHRGPLARRRVRHGEVEGGDDGAGERGRHAGVDEDAGDTVLDVGRRAALPRGDDDQAGGHGLEDRDAELLLETCRHVDPAGGAADGLARPGGGQPDGHRRVGSVSGQEQPRLGALARDVTRASMRPSWPRSSATGLAQVTTDDEQVAASGELGVTEPGLDERRHALHRMQPADGDRQRQGRVVRAAGSGAGRPARPAPSTRGRRAPRHRAPRRQRRRRRGRAAPGRCPRAPR